MRLDRSFLALFAVSLAAAGTAAAQAPRPQARLVATMEQPETLRGELVLTGIAGGGGPTCFYLGYGDPHFGDDHGSKRRMMFTDKSKLIFSHGDLTVGQVAPSTVVRAPLQEPGLLRLELPSSWGMGDELSLTFEARVPRLPESDASEWFYDGFMPQLLAQCPAPGLEPAYWRTGRAVDITATLTTPPGWQYVGPGTTDPTGRQVARLTGPTFAFALTQAMTIVPFSIDGIDVTVAHRSPAFAELIPTIKNVLPLLTRMFGKLPFPSLTIIETSELQRHGLPGVIAINRPAQAAFSNVQRNWLNWQHWIITSVIARQWFGGAITSQTPDDDWLLAGMNEFATVEALRLLPKRFDLFNADEGGSRFLSFDYLQSSELAAATLRQYAPFETLTDAQFSTLTPLRRQHPLIYVKHAFALRQIKHQAGEAAFFDFLRTFTAAHLHGQITPPQFKRDLDRHSDDLGSHLSHWWTSSGWPDFGLVDFAIKPADGGGHAVRVTASQLGAIDFPPMVGIEDVSGKVHLIRASKTADGLWTVGLTLADEPRKAVIDPNHETFDADRFDNASGPPKFQFFPGSADTLRDDGYTVLWLPYALRRPGEPVSYGLQSAVFRYNQGILFLRAERAPSEGLNALEARHRYQWPTTAMQADLLAEQDYDRDQLAEGTLTRAPVFAGNPQLAVGLKLRSRERVDEAHSRHATYALTANLKPLGAERVCDYNLSVETERAPEALADGYSYERTYGSALATCEVTTNASLAVRGFAGKLSPFGPVPTAAAFKPTELKEARIRLDKRALPSAKRIASIGTDVLLPFYLPLPSDSLVLTRQMRWRLFHDYGRAEDLDVDYQAAGLGFLLPFGGDVSGAGTLSLTRLTVLAILYGRVDDDVSRQPSVVFDLTGEL